MTIVARLVLVATVVAAPAHAQSPEAESLFREGKALLAKGKVAQACEKLEASDQIDRKAGTELNLGDCREKNKQLASAWATFLKAAATAKNENDPKRALELAHKACFLSEDRNPGYLDTLAACLASDDRFTEAILTEEKAMNMVPDSEQDVYRARLEEYRKGIKHVDRGEG